MNEAQLINILNCPVNERNKRWGQFWNALGINFNAKLEFGLLCHDMLKEERAGNCIGLNARQMWTKKSALASRFLKG